MLKIPRFNKIVSNLLQLHTYVLQYMAAQILEEN